MRLLVYLLAGSLAGFGAHRAYRPSTQLGDRWGTILRYGIGGMLILPFMLLFADLLIIKARSEEKDDHLLVSIGTAYLLSTGSVAAGTICGHLVDRLNGD